MWAWQTNNQQKEADLDRPSPFWLSHYYLTLSSFTFRFRLLIFFLLSWFIAFLIHWFVDFSKLQQAMLYSQTSSQPPQQHEENYFLQHVDEHIAPVTIRTEQQHQEALTCKTHAKFWLCRKEQVETRRSTTMHAITCQRSIQLVPTCIHLLQRATSVSFTCFRPGSAHVESFSMEIVKTTKLSGVNAHSRKENDTSSCNQENTLQEQEYKVLFVCY